MQDGVDFLVTCPVDFYARARVTLVDHERGIEAPADCPKSEAALRATLAHLGRQEVGARLEITSPIPRSKGLGSSSADVAATVYATGLALGVELDPATVARIAITVEPSDGVMFPGLALFDHREGRIVEILGPPPPMALVALDFGGTVDTVEFNASQISMDSSTKIHQIHDALVLGIKDYFNKSGWGTAVL